MQYLGLCRIRRTAQHFRHVVVYRTRWILLPLVVAAFILFILKVVLLPPQVRIAGEAILHYKCNGKLDTHEDTSTAEENFETRLHSVHEQIPSVCLNEKCRAAYVKHFQKSSVYPIPAIRHILWKNESVSKYFAAQLRSWQKLHPDWTFVFWRDTDLVPFVANHFPGLLAKFTALPSQIMRVDMIRYMLLFMYGGVYADLDYRLVRSLDNHRRFHAVVTREPDAHALLFRSMSWPVKPLANPAFLMAAPGHPFFLFVIQKLLNAETVDVLDFAGPFGLTCMMENYMRLFPVASHPASTVYVPPSYSFYPYQDNKINTSRSDTVEYRLTLLAMRCKSLMSGQDPEMREAKRSAHMRQFCRDVNNMDPITDRSQPVFAIHDLQKAGGIWYRSTAGHSFYITNLVDIRQELKNVIFGIDFFRQVRLEY